MTLPTDSTARKRIPLYSECVAYFPDVLAAVAELSQIGNDQHHPDEPLHWDKSKSTDEMDALMRHAAGCAGDPVARDEDGVLEATKVAWRALANLQRLADDGVNVFAESSYCMTMEEARQLIRETWGDSVADDLLLDRSV